ncbi:unnamed protein product, partial [Prorocentrum cordatum]
MATLTGGPSARKGGAMLGDEHDYRFNDIGTEVLDNGNARRHGPRVAPLFLRHRGLSPSGAMPGDVSLALSAPRAEAALPSSPDQFNQFMLMAFAGNDDASVMGVMDMQAELQEAIEAHDARPFAADETEDTMVDNCVQDPLGLSHCFLLHAGEKLPLSLWGLGLAVHSGDEQRFGLSPKVGECPTEQKAAALRGAHVPVVTAASGLTSAAPGSGLAPASEEPDLAIPHLSAETPTGSRGLDHGDHGFQDVDQLLAVASPQGHLDVDDAVAEDSGSDGNDSGLEGTAKLLEGKDVTGAKKRRRHHDELAKVLRAEMAHQGTLPLTPGELAGESTAPSSTQTPQTRPRSAAGVRGPGSEIQIQDQHGSVFDSPGDDEVVAAPPAPLEPSAPAGQPPALSRGMSSQEESLPNGARVRLQNIRSSPQLNGVAATVIRFDRIDGHYVVELEEAEGRPQKQVQVPRAKLKAVLETPRGRLPNQAMHLGIPSSIDHTDQEILTPHSKQTLLTAMSLRTEESKTLGFRLGYWSNSPVLAAMKGYSRLVVACPCCMIVLYIVLVCLTIVVFWRPFELEMDFSAFISADGDASRQRHAYLAALDEKKAPTSSRRLHEVGEASSLSDVDDGELGVGRRLFAKRVVKRQLTVVYSAKDGRAFEEKVLRDIHSLETRLRAELADVCSMSVHSSSMDNVAKCNPGITFDMFAWPTQTQLGAYSTRGNFE